MEKKNDQKCGKVTGSLSSCRWAHKKSVLTSCAQVISEKPFENHLFSKDSRPGCPDDLSLKKNWSKLIFFRKKMSFLGVSGSPENDGNDVFAKKTKFE